MQTTELDHMLGLLDLPVSPSRILCFIAQVLSRVHRTRRVVHVRQLN